ncbi:hypothetical protein [Endothiovibrio diazotrophicus]
MDIDYGLLESWLKEPGSPVDGLPPPPHEEGEEPLAAVAARLRPPFQAALIGWYDGRHRRRALTALDRVLEQLEGATRREPNRRLWWVARGVVEALLHEGLAADDALKLLFGRLDRQLKQVAQTGEGAIPPHELEGELLARLTTATAGGERLQAIRRTFDLGEELPVRRESRDSGALPGRHAAKLLHTVAAAIKEDLDGVKEALERIGRDGGAARGLAPHLETLARLGDTLEMLGMAVPRRAVEEQLAILRAIHHGQRRPDEVELVEMTGALLFVESALDGLIGSCADLEEWGERVLTTLHQIRDGNLHQHPDRDPLSALEYRRVTAVVLHQSAIELSGALDATRLLAEGETRQVEEVAARLEGIQGALAMLQRPKAAGLFGILGRQLAPIAREPSTDRLQRLLQALHEAGRYLETAEEDRSDAEQRLDHALELASRLDEAVTESADTTAAPSLSTAV